MPDGFTCSIPTLSDIINGAVRDHGVIANMTYTRHLSDHSAAEIVADAVDAAIEDWYWETGLSDVSADLRADAEAVLRIAGWAAREESQQADIAADKDIWRGAARAEETSNV